MIKIRKATLKDLKEVKRLNQELFYYNYQFDKTLDINWPSKKAHEKYYKESISRKDKICFVALYEDKIVGYSIAGIIKVEDRTVSKMVEAENMFISPEYRSQGIGSIFIKKIIDWTKSKKLNRIKAVISANNSKSVEFHKNNGFKEYDNILEMQL